MNPDFLNILIERKYITQHEFNELSEMEIEELKKIFIVEKWVTHSIATLTKHNAT